MMEGITANMTIPETRRESHRKESPWKDPAYRRSFMKDLERKLGFEPEDWTNATYDLLKRHQALGLLREYPDIAALIMDVFPENGFRTSHFQHRWKSQGLLYSQVVKIMPPDAAIFQEYAYSRGQHPRLAAIGEPLHYSLSGMPMQIDVFVPELRLAFEYQGQQHSQMIGFFHWNKDDFLAQLDRDQEKRECFEKNGIMLVEVPHTWDGSVRELYEIFSSQIHAARTKDQAFSPSPLLPFAVG